MHTIADPDLMTDAEKDLIRAAVGNQGVLEVAVRPDTRGRAVIAGRKKFFDPKDRSVAEHYISLLARLKDMELIHEAANRKAYELTNFGWELSRKLGR
ncbi:MAG TPA: hypothetical protein VHK01_05790 [Lacipirellulaceae bacterium]|nr:hypothetical protein [Lacipirellulaceae bacterium]